MNVKTKITKAMIDDLRAKEDDAMSAYKRAMGLREDAEKRFHQQESGIENGDLVSVTRRGEKKVYFFDHFDTLGWMYGRHRRLNGEPSKAVTCLYRDAKLEGKP